MDQLNWIIPQGDNWIGQDVYADDTGKPYNLTGATVTCVLRRTAGDSAVLLDCTGYVSVKAAAGQINWDVPYAGSLQPLPFPIGAAVDIDGRGTYAYAVAFFAITIHWPAGNSTTILSGNLMFIPD